MPIFTFNLRSTSRYGSARRACVSLAASLCVVLCVFTGARAQIASEAKRVSDVPARWLTPAERTNHLATPTFDETIAYIDTLARESKLIRRTSFGESGEGRRLPLVIAASGMEFDPIRARASGKAIVLVQACIHAGESDGKDAGLALLRDIAIMGKHAEILRGVVLLFVPIYNTDGHERRGPYNRINQIGPAGMGWRATATRLNLNRDYMKADAPETRAWLQLWNKWQPDILVDLHTTDGADFQYDVTYQYEARQNVEPSIAEWMRAAIERRVRPATEKAGHLLAPYLTFRDNRNPSLGIEAFIATPRFATAYAAITRNRPALLVETHALKTNRARVFAAYDILRLMLEDASRERESLRRSVRAADEATTAMFRAAANKSLPLSLELTEKETPFVLKGVEMRRETSDISGAERVIFNSKPQDYDVPLYDDARVVSSVRPPRYYVVPPAWTEIIERLVLHGVRFTRAASPLTLDAEMYRFREVKFAATPFEGRVRVDYKVDPVQVKRTFPAGSIIIPLAQPAARAAVHLLEPAAPDSLVSWGFFNPIFEQKEFGEDYIVERIAREMLARDETLRRDFAERLRTDERFAQDPRARLRFFYERSPYADADLNLYPVARIDARLPQSFD